MDVFEHNGQKLSYVTLGDINAERVFIWAHGWGHTHQNLLAMAEALQSLGRHIVLDFPGFGASPVPNTIWNLTDYAEIAHALIKSLGVSVIWVGHSFGCRVGLRLASLYPRDIASMVLIAAPGLRTPRPWHQEIWVQARIRLFKLLKKLASTPEQVDKLRARFGSADYRNAGPMRPIFLNVLSDYLQDDAKTIKFPLTYIYGEDDKDTPPTLGPRFVQLTPHAALHVLPRFDHHTILGPGRHQVAQIIKDAV
jgi:pimeloyl-ACP methyl ester carboxylesterase